VIGAIWSLSASGINPAAAIFAAAVPTDRATDPRAVIFGVIVFAAAAGISFGLTPLARRVAVRTAAIDHPDEARRVHSTAMPRAGGIAVTIAFVAVGVVATIVNSSAGIVASLLQVPPAALAALFGGAVAAAVLGFLDDRYQLRARWQLIAQLALAAIPVVAGLTIARVNDPFGADQILFDGVFAVAFTVVWIVGMINSINFIDGLDGLSTGVSAIAALTLGLISVTALDLPFVALLCLVFAGALLGFLPWNFHPARLFIGTTGVYLMGYVLAVLSILGTAKIAVALLVLGVPIIDTFWIIVRRLRARQSPFTADRGHLHHRLLDMGLGHRGAVIAIYVMCIVLAVLSLVLSGRGQVYAFLGIVVAGGLLLQLLTRRASEALDASSYDDSSGTTA
jgi:UDP-GlcNAc:undecaprenyl-phosphate GlcNAc-1-phosphate transferase